MSNQGSDDPGKRQVTTAGVGDRFDRAVVRLAAWSIPVFAASLLPRAKAAVVILGILGAATVHALTIAAAVNAAGVILRLERWPKLARRALAVAAVALAFYCFWRWTRGAGESSAHATAVEAVFGLGLVFYLRRHNLERHLLRRLRQWRSRAARTRLRQRAGV
jgi:hypothetical protein